MKYLQLLFMAFFCNSVFFVQGMNEKIKTIWQDDKDVCFKKMREAITSQKHVPYVHESGQLKAWFYGDALEVETFFDDGASDIRSFGLLYDLLERPCICYLHDGIVYNAENKVVGDWSIETMHKEDKKKEQRNNIKQKVNRIFTFFKKKAIAQQN